MLSYKDWEYAQSLSTRTTLGRAKLVVWLYENFNNFQEEVIKDKATEYACVVSWNHAGKDVEIKGDSILFPYEEIKKWIGENMPLAISANVVSEFKISETEYQVNFRVSHDVEYPYVDFQEKGEEDFERTSNMNARRVFREVLKKAFDFFPEGSKISFCGADEGLEKSYISITRRLEKVVPDSVEMYRNHQGDEEMNFIYTLNENLKSYVEK